MWLGGSGWHTVTKLKMAVRAIVLKSTPDNGFLDINNLKVQRLPCILHHVYVSTASHKTLLVLFFLWTTVGDIQKRQ